MKEMNTSAPVVCARRNYLSTFITKSNVNQALQDHHRHELLKEFTKFHEKCFESYIATKTVRFNDLQLVVKIWTTPESERWKEKFTIRNGLW